MEEGEDTNNTSDLITLFDLLGMFDETEKEQQPEHLIIVPPPEYDTAKNITKAVIEPTALITAAKEGKADIVADLLANGADVNFQDPDKGYCAIMEAANYGWTTLVLDLLQHGANPNLKDKTGNTSLMMATFHGHTEVVTTLLEHEADANLQNVNGNTALVEPTSYFSAEHQNQQPPCLLLSQSSAAMSLYFIVVVTPWAVQQVITSCTRTIVSTYISSHTCPLLLVHFFIVMGKSTLIRKFLSLR